MIDDRVVNEISTICKKIADLCGNNNAKNWGDLFHFFAEKLKTDQWDNVKREMLKIFAGMGSFNDLVLHENGLPQQSNNNELDLLRTKLYKLITKNW